MTERDSEESKKNHQKKLKVHLDRRLRSSLCSKRERPDFYSRLLDPDTDTDADTDTDTDTDADVDAEKSSGVWQQTRKVRLERER